MYTQHIVQTNGVWTECGHCCPEKYMQSAQIQREVCPCKCHKTWPNTTMKGEETKEQDFTEEDFIKPEDFDFSPSDKTWEINLEKIINFNPAMSQKEKDGLIGYLKDHFIRDLLTSATIKAKEEVLMNIQNMKLWSKGTVEGTRQDILHKLAVKHGFITDYQQDGLGINLEEPSK